MIKRLVLLPGLHGTGELFAEFMHAVGRAVPDIGRIEALHYPTDARLSYEVLLAVVQDFVPPAEHFFLLAESFSTPLAIQYAATNPPNLKGLILCVGFANSPLKGWRKLLASFIAPLAFRLPLPKIAVSHFLLGPDAPDSLHTAVRAAIRSVKPRVLAARLRQVLAVDVRNALAEISVPVLFIQAQQDRLVGPSCLEEIAWIKPKIEVALIDGPHLILQRKPQQSADVVAQFMFRLQRQA
jgi:pimeloyl-[acyl-carrier protein] methyl ester esterase